MAKIGITRGSGSKGPEILTLKETGCTHIINMPVSSEVILANESGIPCTTIAMSTDYNSWKADETIT
ncbi:MAG: MTAP family purine nucleoside phosphorylase [Bacteroidales bacterium]|nr:MTAP family purine nucleoside phosphorylase [Bacteroidales bacterium]